MSDKESKVVINASEECQAGIVANLRGEVKTDWTITAVEPDVSSDKEHPDHKWFVLRWESKTAGFGEVTFYQEDGKWH